MRRLIEHSPQRLLWVVLGFVVLIAGFLITDGYRTQIELIKERELAKLEGIAGTLSVMIDADSHRKLMLMHEGMDAIKHNEDDSVYYSIHNILRRTKEMHGLSAPVHTMVYEPRIDKFCILVTDSESPEWKHPYRDYPPELLRRYEEGGRLGAYVDSKGTWLSAFHPIKTESGETVGIVQVEERFDDFIAEAKQVSLRNSAISAAVTLFIVFILFLVLRILLAELERLRLEQKELENLRKELLANVSHDLRTPLASIQGYIETVLMMDDLSQEQRNKYLKTALISTEKLKALIEELFDLSRLESRDRKPNLEVFSLAELASDVVAGLRIEALKKGINLSEDIPAQLPSVFADIALINRVLQNVLSNAIKFTHAGGSVILKLSEHSTGVEVDIIDTGIGIPKDELARVFERFRTAEGAKRSGSGLGLAIVKSILEAHDAPYSFSSEPGKGSHFIFLLNKA